MLRLCSYGVNFIWLDDATLIAGISVRDWSPATAAYRKQLRRAGRQAVQRTDVDQLLDRARKLNDATAEDIDTAKAQVVADYKATGAYKRDAVELLRPDIEQSLAQSHDYRNLVSQIIQNINVLLQNKYPGLEIDDQLEKTSQQIRSIYWAARLMEFKLKGPVFLLDTSRITDSNERRIFRFHGAVLKYLKVYQASAASKGVSFQVRGSSYSSLSANPDAVGVIFHAYLDNALKYAPRDSSVIVHFDEDDDSINFAVESLGPRIDKAEQGKIFELFYRGTHAKSAQFEGTGFGLGMAQHVAEYLEVDLKVEQEKDQSEPGLHRTVFSAVFPKPTDETLPTRLERTRQRTRGGKSQLA